MIDVPARVKDAMKSGDYKKNYRITVEGADVIYEHNYQEPEIDIFLFDGPLGEYWTTSDIAITLPNESEKVKIVIDSIVNAFGWDEDFYISWMASPELFEVDEENNITTITMPDHFRGLRVPGSHTIGSQAIQAYPEFTYVKVQGIIDNVLQNDRLVAESVKFDERMCSDTELKFGLCEGASVEFQYFNFKNIRGDRINVELDVQYKDENNALAWCTIPMGWYDVDECSRQASTGIIKATAYNKLKSEYLDANSLPAIYQMLIDDPDHSLPLIDVLGLLLDGYAMDHTTWINIAAKAFTHDTTGHAKWNDSRNDRYGAYYYSGGQWVPCTPWSSPPANAPSDGYFCFFFATFYYLPVIESDEHTTGFYNYTINLAAIYQAVRPYLNTFFDEKNNRVVETNGSPFAVGVRREGMIDAPVEWGTYLNNIGQFTYRPIGSGTKSQSITNTSTYIVTGEITDTLPSFTVMVAAIGSATTMSMETREYEPSAAIRAKITERFNAVYQALSQIQGATILRKNTSPIEEYRLTLSDVEGMSNAITLRDLQSAVFEMNCQYGKLDRVSDLFSGIELNNGALYPRDDLYPANDLLPMGTSESGYPAMYSKLWADEGNVRTFRNLIITYKGTETVEGQTQEVEKKLQRTVNANGTDDYNMSDNWLFKNLVWSDADVATYADAMVAKMQNMSWFPFELWCAGLPYLEAGDAIEIAMQQGTYKSYVLRRNLNGIQNLQDEMINGTLDIF